MATKNMIHLQREHLLNWKLDDSISKSKVQKLQQAIDSEKYGAKEYRLTRKKYSVEDFIDYWANPPFIPRKAIGVYLYLGHNFIFELSGKTEKEKLYQWTNADGESKNYKSLASAETKMCSFLFDKTK
tara:strand:- start:1695 stop:2078 length:384 start_codon:yes stop_codon:yes gene_type:complete